MNKDEVLSTRFFPFWNPESGNQITGFLQMMQEIQKINHKTDQTYVEIGVNIAESSLLAASFDFIKKLILVDMHKKDNHLDICKTRLSHIKKEISFMKRKSQECHHLFEDLSIDILYIDAAHDYSSVKEDLNNFYPKVLHNGFICGHDYSNGWKGVMKAVDDFVEQKSLSIHKVFCDSSFAIRKMNGENNDKKTSLHGNL